MITYMQNIRLISLANTNLIAGLNSFQTILFVFSLMLLMCALTGLGVWLNACWVKRDKDRVIKWFETHGKKVQTIEWILYPNRFVFQKSFQFNVVYTDSINRAHHATVIAPTWSKLEIVEDRIKPDPVKSSEAPHETP